MQISLLLFWEEPYEILIKSNCYIPIPNNINFILLTVSTIDSEYLFENLNSQVTEF